MLKTVTLNAMSHKAPVHCPLVWSELLRQRCKVHSLPQLMNMRSKSARIPFNRKSNPLQHSSEYLAAEGLSVGCIKLQICHVLVPQHLCTAFIPNKNVSKCCFTGVVFMTPESRLHVSVSGTNRLQSAVFRRDRQIQTLAFGVQLKPKQRLCGCSCVNDAVWHLVKSQSSRMFAIIFYSSWAPHSWHWLRIRLVYRLRSWTKRLDTFESKIFKTYCNELAIYCVSQSVSTIHKVWYLFEPYQDVAVSWT